MRKLIFLVLAGLLILSSAGCIYTKIEQPGDVRISTQHKLTSSDFKILGRVSVTGETKLWFGAILTGGKGYQALLKKAQEMGCGVRIHPLVDLCQGQVESHRYRDKVQRGS